MPFLQSEPIAAVFANQRHHDFCARHRSAPLPVQQRI
jgi:hypothetical protein